MHTYKCGRVNTFSGFLLCALGAGAMAGCGGSSDAPSSSANVEGVTSTVSAPPTIAGSPSTTAIVGTAYSFQPSASDTSGAPLTFSITNEPSWATFSATTGRLTGTPTTSDIGLTANIAITVSDGQAMAELKPFQIQISASATPPPSSPPSISGSPPTQVLAGQSYSFTPSASDATGAALSFSIQNKPSWANFSIATGQLTGTPSTSSVGAYSGIVISVSDGAESASLSPFTITVGGTPAATGTATVTWTAPTANTNGTPLTDLAGYTITYGTNAGSLSQSVNISNSGATSYTIQNLAAGTWYFEVAAYGSDGTQSAPSAMESKTIS
jgi:Putative Ig domain